MTAVQIPDRIWDRLDAMQKANYALVRTGTKEAAAAAMEVATSLHDDLQGQVVIQRHLGIAGLTPLGICYDGIERTSPPSVLEQTVTVWIFMGIIYAVFLFGGGSLPPIIALVALIVIAPVPAVLMNRRDQRRRQAAKEAVASLSWPAQE